MLIIGAGRMGRWFANYFKDKYDVYINDIDQRRILSSKLISGVKFIKSYKENIKRFQVVINAVSLTSAEQVIRWLKESGYGGTVVDISTLKTPVNGVLRSMEGAISIHPFFGPGASSIDGKTIALTPLGNMGRELRTARKLFPRARIVSMDEEAHDRLVCYSIELPQLLSLIAIEVLSEGIKEPVNMEGTSSKALKMLIATSLYGSEGLARDIMATSVYTDQLLTGLMKATARIRSISVEEMRKRTAPFRKEYEEFYSLLEKG